MVRTNSFLGTNLLTGGGPIPMQPPMQPPPGMPMQPPPGMPMPMPQNPPYPPQAAPYVATAPPEGIFRPNIGYLESPM